MPPFLGSEYDEDETLFAAYHPGTFNQYSKAFHRGLLLFWFGSSLFLYGGKGTLQLCSGGPQFLFVKKPNPEIPYLERGSSEDGSGDPFLPEQYGGPRRTRGV